MFGIGLGFFIINYALTQSVSQLITAPIINETNKTVEAFQSINTLTNQLDYIIFGVFVGLVLALIITSYFISGHPIFMFIYFIIIVIAVVVSTVLADSWEYLSQMTLFGSTISEFPITNHLLIYLPIYAVVLGFIGLFIMFAKPYISGGQ